MTEAILDHVLLASGALFDARRHPGRQRLTLHPLSTTAAVEPAALAELIAQSWPAEHGDLLINLTSETWLRALLGWLETQGTVAHWWVEVPAFLLGEADFAQSLMQLGAAGQGLVLKGRPLKPLAPELLACFRLAIVDVEEERRRPGEEPRAPQVRTLKYVQSGVLTPEQASASFDRGAIAVLGWPLGDAPTTPPTGSRRELPGAVSTVADLMQRLDREEPIARLEEVLRSDPALAFRLMRYINSPGFGLSVEISSFSHAIMVLGYQRLKRWLALLLTSTVDSPNLRPLMFLAMRRGLLMEELVRSQGDEALRNEAFICGVFSLLDRMLGQPFSLLLARVPVPDRVAQALLDEAGAHAPLLALAQAAEGGVAFDIQSALETLMLEPGEYNRALLRAMTATGQLQAA